MMNKINELNFYIGIVAPLGVDKDSFIDTLSQCTKKLNVDFNKENHTVKISDLIDFCSNEEYRPKSFEIYAKMQLFSHFRNDSKLRILFGQAIIEKIKTARNKPTDRIRIILIDQLKNEFESQLLSFVYGENYIQIGLFSSQKARNAELEKIFTENTPLRISIPDEKPHLERLLKKTKIFLHKKCLSMTECKIPEKYSKMIVDEYLKGIKSDCSCNLLKKDFLDNDEYLSEAGQSVSKIYHRSHFFFNLEVSLTELTQEINKFLEIIQSKYDEYPTQSEFAMALATQASVRSNFANNRYIGATIVSDNGEIISVGSIRSPSPTPNTTKADKEKIQSGYDTYKDKISSWKELLTFLDQKYYGATNNTKQKSLKSLAKEYANYLAAKASEKSQPIENNIFMEMKKFIADSLEFHPCTHAEISAILDAAKLGVSIKGATLYSTTYPCHLCAKDIITGGITKVVFLEPYPKSKNEKLYPHNITECEQGHTGKVKFVPFFGVGPERFHLYYSENNKEGDGKNTIPRQQLNYIKNSAIIANEKLITSYKITMKNKNEALRQLLENPTPRDKKKSGN